MTTAGCADIISNYTAVMDWRLARRLKDVEYSEYAAALSEMTAEILVDNADLVRPGLEVGLDRHQSARLLGRRDEHRRLLPTRKRGGTPLSHQLDRLAPDAALHGHQVGVGSIMTAYLHGGERGFWRDIRDALSSIDAPTTAAELGIDDDTVIEALTSCHEIRDRYTILGDGMNEHAAREVATKTGVIG